MADETLADGIVCDGFVCDEIMADSPTWFDLNSLIRIAPDV